MVIKIKGEFIELNKLLKFADLVPTGGVAGMLIANGEIKVDGKVELRKRCKIYRGQRVSYNGEIIEVK